jgi:hypothetical protein
MNSEQTLSPEEIRFCRRMASHYYTGALKKFKNRELRELIDERITNSFRPYLIKPVDREFVRIVYYLKSIAQGEY